MKLILIATHLSHYRTSVYEQLSRRWDGEVELFGSTRRLDGIEAIDASIAHLATHIRPLRFGPFCWQVGIRRHLKDHPADFYILLGDFKVLSTWLLLRRIRKDGRRVLLWTQGWRKKDPWLVKHVRLKFYGMSTGLLLYSERGRELALAQGMENDRLYVIGNASESREMIHSRKRIAKSTPSDTLTVGAVSRIARAKRYDVLLEGARMARAQGLNVIVRLAGAGEDSTRLIELASELGVPLELSGPIYDDELLEEFYESIDLTVVPENLGLTAIQSMSYGVPVATSGDPSRQGPEVEAVIHGVTGYLFDGQSPADISRTLVDFSRLTSETRSTLTDAAVHEVLTSWTADRQAERILMAVQDVLGLDDKP